MWKSPNTKEYRNLADNTTHPRDGFTRARKYVFTPFFPGPLCAESVAAFDPRGGPPRAPSRSLIDVYRTPADPPHASPVCVRPLTRNDLYAPCAHNMSSDRPILISSSSSSSSSPSSSSSYSSSSPFSVMQSPAAAVMSSHLLFVFFASVLPAVRRRRRHCSFASSGRR
ncbi:hypothetical protein QTP88_025860 [Uroleucon formosanum]